MSPIDPRPEQARRRERARGNPGWLAATVAAGLADALTGFLFGVGLGSVLDTFRVMALHSVFEGDRTGPGPEWAALAVGVFGGAVTAVCYVAARRRFTGGSRVGVSSFALKAIGGALGAWWAVRSWREPTAVGHTVTASGATQSWGPGAWIMYAMLWWLPALFAAGALAALVAAPVLDVRRRRREEHIERMLASDVRREGTVDAVGETGTAVDGHPLVRFTVRYVDVEGRERWVTKSSVLDTVVLPRVGDPADVWYDPSRPEDEHSVVVTLAGVEKVERGPGRIGRGSPARGGTGKDDPGPGNGYSRHETRPDGPWEPTSR